jgi:hypothetical protein
MDILFTLFIILLVLGIIWVVLRFALKLTMRVFSCGCSIILLIALILILLRYIFGVI